MCLTVSTRCILYLHVFTRKQTKINMKACNYAIDDARFAESFIEAGENIIDIKTFGSGTSSLLQSLFAATYSTPKD